MNRMKRQAIIFSIFLLLASLSGVYAQEVGCCVNPGAGGKTCTVDLVSKSLDCCPQPETSNTAYYKSAQNPNGPTNFNDCASRFFFPNQDCSSVDKCAIGCCCSDLGGTITPEAQCTGTGTTFYKWQTNCNQFCATPQCSDGVDNDNNGCADFTGGDLGCSSSSDAAESGGSCSAQPISCSDQGYTPKLSSLQITPAKGQKKFSMSWQDECSQNSLSYEILRCKGSGCTNFALMGSTAANSFEDASDEIEYNATYTYQIKAHYSPQTAAPTITKSASLGDSACSGKASTNVFCLNNEAFYCDANNRLVPKGLKCPSSKVCVVDNENAICLNKENCNHPGANPFGLYYTLDTCENNRYCFYDRSHATVDFCFACDPSMACYDYKSEQACSRDNCNVGNCKWKNLAASIGTGVCVSATGYNCQWCDKKGTSSMGNIKSYNEVFDICAKEKSDALSEGNFKCYFSASERKSKACNNVICTDYGTAQCSAAQITHDENNKITNPSSDECGIKACQNIGNSCVKNADGDNQADCDNAICEGDYYPPTTILQPVANSKNILQSLLIQINDKTEFNGSESLRTSSSYVTFLCVEPCGENGHPYAAFTKSKNIIISNLKAFDGSNGTQLLSLNEGLNVIRYYSQDPSKNIGEVKKITIDVHSNTTGPRVLNISVSNSTEVLGKFFTKSQKPAIEIQFFEPAIVTFARLVSKDNSKIVNLQGNTQLNTKVILQATETLPNNEYKFELNAKDKNNIFMSPPYSALAVVDNAIPKLDITPSNGAIFTTSPVAISLAFDKEVSLESAAINSQDIKSAFSTTDNKLFTAALNLSDGNKNLQVGAKSLSGMQAAGSASFIVDAKPTSIILAKPKFGVASNHVFDIVVETDNNANCRHSLDDNFDYETMDGFQTTGGTTHMLSNFNNIKSNDTNSHKLYVRCKEDRYGISFKSFDISVDSTHPRINSAFAFPSPVIEQPAATKLTAEADEPVVCRYSDSVNNFDLMENIFDDFNNNSFKIIAKQNITVQNQGNHSYFVACQNKAGLKSETKEIIFNVDFSIPITIISHTPEFFDFTKIVLAVESNKKSQCKYSETDSTALSGPIFGPIGYSHTAQLNLSNGKHVFYVACRDQFLGTWSSVKAIEFTIDVTPPTMLFVDDKSPSESFPEVTCYKDRLRVKWLGSDAETNVKEYAYTIINKSSNKQLINETKTFWRSDTNNGDEWKWIDGIRLGDNTQYLFSVKAINFVNLMSSPKTSDGITVNTTHIPLCKDAPKCGDNELNAGEECDGSIFGAIDSCLKFTNFIGGSLKCTACKLDTSGCVRVPTCGNGELDPGESCDGAKFGQIRGCTDYNQSFSGGTLKCTQTCQLDTSACAEKPKCGNGAIDRGESCDSTNIGPLNGKCVGYSTSFTDGNLSCDGCKIDTLKCQGVSGGSCGDGVLNIGESCDVASFGGIDSCNDYDTFSGGTLKCTQTCQLDTSACAEKPKCGNGAIDRGESCDSTNLGPLNGKCADYSTYYDKGSIKCTSECKLDTASCGNAQTCGNDELNTGEVCDGTKFFNLTDTSCISYSPNFINGTLSCKSCKISTSSCISNTTAAASCKYEGKCKAGESCTDNSDCESKYCTKGANKCAAPTCSDGVKNQGEPEADCGGTCSAKCQNNAPCNTNGDCQSSFCSFGFCRVPEMCSDSKLNPGETGIDCGGVCPTKCPAGKNCDSSTDCEDGLDCVSSVCKKCTDKDKNCNGILDEQEDSDGDGIPDAWELQNGLEPNNPNDGSLDADKDGLTNYEEYVAQRTYGKGTNPNVADTDGDGVSDKEELDKGTSPVDPEDFPKSRIGTIILLIFGIIVLISGFGYLAYSAIMKRQEKSEAYKAKAFQTIPKPMVRQIPLRPKAQDIQIKEALKKREEQKQKEREKLFGTFAGKAEEMHLERQKEVKEAKAEKPELKKKIRAKAKVKKSKEDIFVKLKGISREEKKAKSSK